MIVGIDVSGKKIYEVIDIIEDLDLPDGYTIKRQTCNKIILAYDDAFLTERENQPKRKRHARR